MIRYSTQPKKDANTITDSPTSKIITTKDTRNLNDDGKPSQSIQEELDPFGEDLE
jgi:hypothetical protein